MTSLTESLLLEVAGEASHRASTCSDPAGARLFQLVADSAKDWAGRFASSEARLRSAYEAVRSLLDAACKFADVERHANRG